MGKTILVADDSKTIQRVVEMTFEKTEFRVFGVSSGDEAVARIAEVQPDVVLADVGMTGRDGFAVCSALKEQPATSNIPIVLLSSGQNPADESRVAQSGADGHLTKPFETQALISVIKEITGAQMQSQVPASFAQTLARQNQEPSSPPSQAPVIDDLGMPAAPSTPPQSSPFGPPSSAFTPPPAAASSPPMGGFEAPADPPMAMSEDISFEDDVEIEEIEPMEEVEMSMPTGPSLEPPPAPGSQAPQAPVDVWALAEGDEAPAAARQAIAEVSIEEQVPAPQRIAEAAAPAVADYAAAAVPGLPREELLRLARQVIEQVAWEVVPDLAETIIKEELRRLTGD